MSRKKNCSCPIKAIACAKPTSPILSFYGKIIVELKALTELLDDHRAQLLNYLKATRLKVGLLINFGHYPAVQIERYAL